MRLRHDESILDRPYTRDESIRRLQRLVDILERRQKRNHQARRSHQQTRIEALLARGIDYRLLPMCPSQSAL